MGESGHVVNEILIHSCIAQKIQLSVRLMGVIDLTQLNLTNDSRDAGKLQAQKKFIFLYMP